MANQVNKKKASSNKRNAAIAAGLFGVATLFGTAACKSPTNDDSCTCPNNTVHDNPCTCSGTDCTCESKKLNWNITLVDNTSGGLVTADNIRLINATLNALTGQPYAATMQARNDVVLKIVDDPVVKTTNLSTIEIGIGNFSLPDSIFSAVLDSQIDKLYYGIISMHRFDPNIRLANGKNLPVYENRECTKFVYYSGYFVRTETPHET
jgi:hypothetical protein